MSIIIMSSSENNQPEPEPKPNKVAYVPARPYQSEPKSDSNIISRSRSKSNKSNKIDWDELEKYKPQRPPGDENVVYDDSMVKMLYEKAYNARENERRDKEYAKRREQELKQMEASSKKWEEEQKHKAEFFKKLPGIQLKMILSGSVLLRNSAAPIRTYRHGLTLLKQKYNAGRLIDVDELDERTRKRGLDAIVASHVLTGKTIMHTTD